MCDKLSHLGRRLTLNGSFAIGPRVIDTPTLLGMAASYGSLLSPFLDNGSNVLICGGDADRLEQLVQVLGCLLAGVKPILDEKRLLNSCVVEGARAEYAPAPAAALATNKGGGGETGEAGRMVERLHALRDWDAPALSFATSGSTGDPKLVDKHWRALHDEALALAQLHDIRAGHRIVSLVSPFHIYGFLHTLMVGLVSGAQVVFVPNPALLLDEACGIDGRIDLLVSVPPLWPVTKILAHRVGIGTLVNSGARFGAARTAELVGVGRAIAHSCEIIGSTETGGIGYRDLTATADGPFTLLKGLKLIPPADVDGRFILQSRFLYPLTSYKMDDEISMVDDQHFFHLGRVDNVFKYAGKRYSLSEIERLLAGLLGHDSVHCLFISRENHSKGGELIAVIESQTTLCENTLRREFVRSAGSRTPPPERFIIVPCLPRDANGKVERTALMRLATLN